METTEINGRRVHLGGAPAGPMVAFVRLAAPEAGVWDGLWAALEGRFRLMAVDLPRPRSAADDPAGLLTGLAREVVAIAGEIAPDPFHLVGWTGGTQIALAAAITSPQALASMTLVTPFREIGERRRMEAGLSFIEAMLRTGSRELYARYWFLSGLGDRFLEEKFDVVEDLVRRRLETDPFLALDPAEAMAWMRAIRTDWILDDLVRRIEVPTLVVGAGQNRWHAGPSRAMAERLAALVPGAHLHIVKEAGPLVLVEAAERVAAFIADHIEGARARRVG